MANSRKTMMAAAIAQLTLISSGSAWAQAAAAPSPPPKKDEPSVIVVTGQRAALQSAQKVKQDAEEIVDSIVADDIGKLCPRRSQ